MLCTSYSAGPSSTRLPGGRGRGSHSAVAGVPWMDRVVVPHLGRHWLPLTDAIMAARLRHRLLFPDEGDRGGFHLGRRLFSQSDRGRQRRPLTRFPGSHRLSQSLTGPRTGESMADPVTSVSSHVGVPAPPGSDPTGGVAGSVSKPLVLLCFLVAPFAKESDAPKGISPPFPGWGWAAEAHP